MITDTAGLYIFLAGLACLFVLRFYNGKFWYVFLIMGIGLMALRFTMDDLVILKPNEQKEEYLTFQNSIVYTSGNGKTENVYIGSNTIINDTEFDLEVESVAYGTTAYSTNGNEHEASIPSYSCQLLSNGIDYYYNEPPSSIRVKGGGSRIKFWLHK